jgi:hypothetical protein
VGLELKIPQNANYLGNLRKGFLPLESSLNFKDFMRRTQRLLADLVEVFILLRLMKKRLRLINFTYIYLLSMAAEGANKVESYWNLERKAN